MKEKRIDARTQFLALVVLCAVLAVRAAFGEPVANAPKNVAATLSTGVEIPDGGVPMNNG